MIDEVLAYLVKHGAHMEPVKITTRDIAYELEMSQQTASRKILDLIRLKKIVRTKEGIAVTKEALDSLKEQVNMLQKAIYPERGIEFTGKVEKGLGEGAKFLKLPPYKENIKKTLGFYPYAGTLNVKINREYVEKRLTIRENKEKKYNPLVINGFQQDGKEYGKIDCYRCKIKNIHGEENGAVVFPARSAHGLHVLELIAPVNLRKELLLKEQSWVDFTVYP